MLFLVKNSKTFERSCVSLIYPSCFKVLLIHSSQSWFEVPMFSVYSHRCCYNLLKRPLLCSDQMFFLEQLLQKSLSTVRVTCDSLLVRL